MDWVDSSYLVAVSLAGATARALVRGLPPDWRLRLEAAPPPDLEPGWIWVHAVSVGELLLAEGLLGRLRDAGHRIHVTTGTANGLALLGRRLPGWDQGSGRVTGGPFPLDDPRGLAPFLAVPPGGYVCLETEIWPNLLRELEARGIPACIVNGRLTARTLARGGRWLRRAASRITVVAARDAASAEAWRSLGAPRVEVGGNLKADLPEPRPLHAGWDPLRQAWAADPVVVAGNTVEGEEAALLEAWDQVRRGRPGLRLILAPRQPRRFQEVADLLAGRRLRRASEPWPGDADPWRDTDILLLDTLGELASAYREGTVALVGGGWTWHGGHNPLEPVRFGLPTLLGPGFANFEDLVLPLREAGLVQVVEGAALAEEIARLLDAAPLRPALAGIPVAYPESLTGALGKTINILKNCLPSVR
ncbi:MAG TPA: glycosyltransferase N-terminal domain-containing protein [Holophaga sp.]|nr:glycosyltransferase N-terminal domain-containing protein [Holophaga sp.]